VVDERRGRHATRLFLCALALALVGTGFATKGHEGGAAASPIAVPAAPADATVTSAPAPAPAPAPPSTPATNPPPLVPGRTAPVVLVVGDSIAESVASVMTDTAAPSGVQVINGAMEGCGVMAGSPLHYVGHEQPQPDGCDDWPQRWQDLVDTNVPDVAVLMVGRWEVVDRVVAGDWHAIGDPVFDADLAGRLEQAVQILTSRGATVVVTTAPYYLRAVPPDGGLYPEDEPSRADAFNAMVRALATRHPGQVTIADFGALLDPDGVYTDEVGGVRVRRDGVHLTAEGCSMAADWLLSQVLASVRPTA